MQQTAHHRVLTAFFRRRADADQALERLLAMGVPADGIRLIPKTVAQRDDLGLSVRTRAVEGAALGGIALAIIGAVTGALAAGGSIILPLLGIVLAGPVVAGLALGGAAAILGAMIGAMMGAQRHTCEARYLEDAVVNGGALIAVRCLGDGWRRIVDALCRSGGMPVRLRS